MSNAWRGVREVNDSHKIIIKVPLYEGVNLEEAVLNSPEILKNLTTKEIARLNRIVNNKWFYVPLRRIQKLFRR